MADLPKSPISQQDFDKLIEETSKQYEIYVALNNVALVLNYNVPVETYQRDLDHPLSIQLKS